MPSPRQTFEDNIRPAELLVNVYRLLENDAVLTCGDMFCALRGSWDTIKHVCLALDELVKASIAEVYKGAL